MGETIQQFKNQLNEYWQGMDKNKRKKLIIIGIIALLSIIILTFIFTRTNYEVLYNELSLEDVGEITDKLDEIGVKWKTPKGDPTTILVPAEVKDKVKIELAKDGLPKDGYSFLDAFDDSSWTMTDYDKKERMKLALQNELASTISEIDGIKNATVYINLEDDTGFVLKEDQNKTSASVFIETDSNKTLKAETISAIQNLVASSVNMDAQEVQVIDSEGKLLSGNQDDSETMMTDQFLIKSNLENKINLSIKKFLENIFGPGNVDIRSSVTINFDSEKTSSVEFQPPVEGSEEGLVRSMEEVEEHVTGSNAGGSPGTEENPRNYTMNEGSQENYDKRSNVINYELNQINKEIEKAPGQVEDITVAVLINKDVLVDGSLTQETEKDIQDLIYAATGLNTKQVEVYSEKFITEDNQISQENVLDMKWPIILAALIGIMSVGGFVIYRRRKNKKLEELEELQNKLDDEQAISVEAEDLDFELGKSEIKNKINKFVDKNPEAVAQLLRTWLNE